MDYQLLANAAVYLSVITGVIVIFWAIDDFIFKSYLFRTDLGDAVGYFLSYVIPWAFGTYAVIFIGYSLYIGLGINIDISINNSGG